MSLLQLRIGGRLYAGFGALLLFCMALAGFAVWQLSAIGDRVKETELQSRNAIRVSDIAAELQAIRRAVLRYAFDQDEASFAESEKRLAAVSNLLADAERTTSSDERRAIYRELAKDVVELKAKRAELGEAVAQMLAGRKLLFTDGDQMAADVQKLVDAAQGTPFEHAANALETKVLLVRVANWRMLATRDVKGVATFKTNLGKANEQLAAIEKSELPGSLAALLAPVKTGIAKYAAAFDKTGPNLVRGDEIYYKSITPIIVGAVDRIEKVKTSISEKFESTIAETNGRVETTITAQEVVAGAAVLLGLLIAFLIARGIIRPLAA